MSPQDRPGEGSKQDKPDSRDARKAEMELQDRSAETSKRISNLTTRCRTHAVLTLHGHVRAHTNMHAHGELLRARDFNWVAPKFHIGQGYFRNTRLACRTSGQIKRNFGVAQAKLQDGPGEASGWLKWNCWAAWAGLQGGPSELAGSHK